MADAVGILTKYAFKKERGLYGAGPAIAFPDVPTGTALAATHQIPAASDSLILAQDRSKDPALVGAGVVSPSDIIKKVVQGTIQGRLRYEGWERLALCAFGFENAETTNGSPYLITTGAYRHLFELDNDLQDEAWAAGERTGGSANDRKVRRGVLGIYKQVSPDWVYYSVYVDKMTITGTPQGIDISFDLIGYDHLRGSYNHASWTLPGNTNAQAIFPNARMRLGTEAGGVGSVTDQRISGFEFTLANNIKGDDQSCESGENIEQPCRGGFREVTLKLDYPRYSTDLYPAAFSADTPMMGALVFTGPQILSTGQYFRWAILMDRLIWNEHGGMPTEDPGPYKESFSFQAHRSGNSTVWKASYYPNINEKKDSEVRLLIQNQFATNYLNEN